MDFLIDKISELLIRMLDFFLVIVSRILKRNVRLSNYEGLKQFIRFGIVGVSNTLISYVFYTGALLAMRNMRLDYEYDYIFAGIAAFFTSATWSYYWNNKKVFINSTGLKLGMSFSGLVKTYIAYSFSGIFLGSLLLTLWVDVMEISEYIAPLLNVVIHVPINFVINKFWTFNKR